MNKEVKTTKVGELRPSQLIYTFGVGSLIDLPNLSVMVMGLDDWDLTYSTDIVEDRLIATVQKRFPQVERLVQPPMEPSNISGNSGTSSIGVPVVPFPRWMRCSRCETLAPIESGVFDAVYNRYNPERTRYVHKNCLNAREGPVLSVRFMLACREGHITDFPWLEFVHKDKKPCKGAQLKIRDLGTSGDASDVLVKCESCGLSQRMANAFRSHSKFKCKGHHPHLRTFDSECPEDAKAILLGASNAWFQISVSALTIPSTESELSGLVEENWINLNKIPNISVVQYLRDDLLSKPTLIPLFTNFSDQQIWDEIERRKSGALQTVNLSNNIKQPEWEAFSNAVHIPQNRNFKLNPVDPPVGFEDYFEKTVLVERLREVRALLGFTRIESNADFPEPTKPEESRYTRICRDNPKWLPATEVHGEGIFLRIRQEPLKKWLEKPSVRELENTFLIAHMKWREFRDLVPHEEHFPGIQFVLLHSLSHTLMRQIVKDCGYNSGSIRERLYFQQADLLDDGSDMTGILIYTAAPDSEGTLGGLVEIGKPKELGSHLQQALENVKLCASDPLCSDHEPDADTSGLTIQGACCHACQFVPETSCEFGNRYLDRSVLVETLAERGTSFFGS